MFKDLQLESGIRIIVSDNPKTEEVYIATYFKDNRVDLNQYGITFNDAVKLSNALKEIADV